MSEQPIIFNATDGVATLTLNRPAALNAMTADLMTGLSDSLRIVEQDQSIRVVVLTGNGRGFCAGADLTAAADQVPDKDHSSHKLYNDTMRAIVDCPVPTVARINRAAAGGGLGLALACDITIATDDAIFVATFGPNLGIVPDMGATWTIPRLVGRSRALGLTLLGSRLSGQEAADWGLIWRSVPGEQLDQAVSEAVATLKRSNPSTCTRIRQSVDAALDNSFSQQLDLELEHQRVLLPRNMQTGAKAFLQKTEPLFGPERD